MGDKRSIDSLETVPFAAASDETTETLQPPFLTWLIQPQTTCIFVCYVQTIRSRTMGCTNSVSGRVIEYQFDGLRIPLRFSL